MDLAIDVTPPCWPLTKDGVAATLRDGWLYAAPHHTFLDMLLFDPAIGGQALVHFFNGMLLIGVGRASIQFGSPEDIIVRGYFGPMEGGPAPSREVRTNCPDTAFYFLQKYRIH